MPHKFDPCDEPTEGKRDTWGFTIKPTISGTECLSICLTKAPCGIDKKQSERLVKEFENGRI